MAHRSSNLAALRNRDSGGHIKRDEIDLWRKIRVTSSGVIVLKEFHHKYKPGSKLYLSSTNDILLEFTADVINIHRIMNDSSTSYIDEIKCP